MTTRKITQDGLDFIQDVEGCKLFAYRDTGGVWTIGVGHTGPEVVKGLTCSMEQALQWLKEDSEEAQEAVRQSVDGLLTQNQFNALVSFVFNVGVNAFKKSTMLKLINKGDFDGAAKEFPKWNKDNGKEVLGLSKRRILEQSVFEKA
jgi:lysozyme